MSVYKNNQRQKSIYKGSTKIARIYKGSTLVYQNGLTVFGLTSPNGTPGPTLIGSFSTAGLMANIANWIDRRVTITSITGTLGQEGSYISNSSMSFSYFKTVTFSGTNVYVYRGYISYTQYQYYALEGSTVGSVILGGTASTNHGVNSMHPSAVNGNTVTDSYGSTWTKNSAYDAIWTKDGVTLK